MFTKNDFLGYLEEVENIYKKMLTVNTDVLNLLDNKEIKNKLNVILLEDRETFKTIRTRKQKFS